MINSRKRFFVKVVIFAFAIAIEIIVFDVVKVQESAAVENFVRRWSIEPQVFLKLLLKRERKKSIFLSGRLAYSEGEYFQPPTHKVSREEGAASASPFLGAKVIELWMVCTTSSITGGTAF